MKCPKCGQDEVWYHAIIAYSTDTTGRVVWEDNDEESSWLQCENCGSKYECEDGPKDSLGEIHSISIGKEIDSQA